MKIETIKAKITELKPIAIKLGYDYPTQDNLDRYNINELRPFLAELRQFIRIHKPLINKEF